MTPRTARGLFVRTRVQVESRSGDPSMMLETLTVPLVLGVAVAAMAQQPPGAPAQPGQSVAPEKSPPAAAARDDAAAEKLGWRLAVQAWTFRDRTAFEAIDAAKKLGIRYI